jgi:hypothetical protein
LRSAGIRGRRQLCAAGDRNGGLAALRIQMTTLERLLRESQEQRIEAYAWRTCALSKAEKPNGYLASRLLNCTSYLLPVTSLRLMTEVSTP